MPINEAAVLGGSVLGILGLTYATFTAVSYQEVKRKIEEQVAAGEQPYELRTDSADSFKSNRAKPAQKKKKNKASSGKRK